jgi:hypothetical protein
MEHLQMSETIYQMVTDRIIEQREKGAEPWRRPWRNDALVNWVTQRGRIAALILFFWNQKSMPRLSKSGKLAANSAKVKKARLLFSGNGLNMEMKRLARRNRLRFSVTIKYSKLSIR